MVKRVTKTCNLFCYEMSWKIIFVQVAWIQTFKLDKNTRESHHTRNLRLLLQNKFALGRWKAQHVSFSLLRAWPLMWRAISQAISVLGIRAYHLTETALSPSLWLSFYPWCTLVIVTNSPCYLKVSLVRGSRWKYAKKRRKRWVILQFCCFCSHQLILENENYWN